MAEEIEGEEASHYPALTGLFASIFWPAAAGNIFWAACSLIVGKDAKFSNPEIGSSFLVLVILTLYFSVEWVRNYGVNRGGISWYFWIFESLHIVLAVFAALAAYERQEWLAGTVCGFFVVTAIYHFTNWFVYASADREEKSAESCQLMWVNWIGVACLLGLPFVWGSPYHVPASCGVALALWAIVRRAHLWDAWHGSGSQKR